MKKKSGLGRGLDALIPVGDENLPATEFVRQPAAPLSGAGITQLSIQDISPNPRQPRGQMDPQELAELADSIRRNGVLQPIIVTPATQLGKFVLIAGGRRLKASRMAGLSEIPAIVREASELERLELALIENVQRTDLSPLEAAEAYRQLDEEFSLSHEEIAERVGKSRTAVTNTLRLLKLPDDVRQALNDKRISEGHARALLGLPTAQAQSGALHTVLKNELNVRQVEELVRRLTGQRPEPAPRPSPAPEVTALEERLRQSLGTRVELKPHQRGGALVLHYYSEEELDALVERLLSNSRND
jgi:ParB family chromosome partitioning protein